ncbi:hypothetical protein RJT34_32393 [Clitoria ternatea]|uniref:Uncharacterized protein n=1 Tax=Clitoria ternatea TaxID=43366 RepID=A0AAN9F3V6_CLITE
MNECERGKKFEETAKKVSISMLIFYCFQCDLPASPTTDNSIPLLLTPSLSSHLPLVFLQQLHLLPSNVNVML